MTRWLRGPFLLLLLSAAGCEATTGGGRVTFSAAAAGPADAAGAPLRFTTALGYDVTLDRAVLHIGAVYLNQSLPISGAQGTACILPGTYVGQVLGGVDVDLLSAQPRPFPVLGTGTTLWARAAEVWLTGGDIDATEDSTVILDAAGVAERAGARLPFAARVTIGQNRAIPSADPAAPGLNPPCKQRIVTPIPVDLAAVDGGALLLRADPRGIFGGVDYQQVPEDPADPALRRFHDRPDNPADVALWNGLRARAGVYRFTFN